MDTHPPFSLLQGYLAHKKLPLPKDHRRVLGTSLLQGPSRWLFLMSKVPLYGMARALQWSWGGGAAPEERGTPAQHMTSFSLLQEYLAHKNPPPL